MIIKENIIKKNIFLSICIPTFNRSDKTLDLVRNLLSYKQNDIEVVVLDNCSTDDTQLLLSEIKDERLIYIRNEQNIGSMPNVLKSLTHGEGEFVLLCLDKDRIVTENLPYLIRRIRDDNEVVLGQCALNTNYFEKDIVYDKGLLSIKYLAYTSEHPSGLFIKRSLLNNAGIINKIIDTNKSFAFNTELLKAEMSILGKSKRINIPLIYTETLAVCEKELSHTYKGDNIYFFPKKIIETFNIYIQNLYSLNLPKNHKRIVSKYIYISLLNASTSGFKNIMKNRSICTHHGIDSHNVGFGELLLAYKNFNINFFSKENKEDFFWKIRSFVSLNSKIIVKLIALKLKK